MEQEYLNCFITFTLNSTTLIESSEQCTENPRTTYKLYLLFQTWVYISSAHIYEQILFVY